MPVRIPVRIRNCSDLFRASRIFRSRSNTCGNTSSNTGCNACADADAGTSSNRDNTGNAVSNDANRDDADQHDSRICRNAQ